MRLWGHDLVLAAPPKNKKKKGVCRLLAINRAPYGA